MYFVETRLGEPITAIDSKGDLVAFGSISGFYGRLNVKDNSVKYSKVCENELIRDIIIKEDIYLAVGDQKILVVDKDTLDIKKSILLEDYKHLSQFCPNMMSWLRESEGEVIYLLSYFPTLDSIKLTSELTSNQTNFHPTFLKKINSKEINFSKKFKPKNYSVPMDFDGKRIIWIFREMKNKNTKNKLFQIQFFDFQTEKQTVLNLKDKTIKLIRFFQRGIVFVSKNKIVSYYDFDTNQSEVLYNQSSTVVLLCCDTNFIVSMDKQLKLNIFNFMTKSFVSNDIYFKSLDDIPDIKYRYFEMEYPYFSKIKGNLFTFTCDFGIFTIDIEKQFNK